MVIGRWQTEIAVRREATDSVRSVVLLPFGREEVGDAPDDWIDQRKDHHPQQLRSQRRDEASGSLRGSFLRLVSADHVGTPAIPYRRLRGRKTPGDDARFVTVENELPLVCRGRINLELDGPLSVGGSGAPRQRGLLVSLDFDGFFLCDTGLTQRALKRLSTERLATRAGDGRGMVNRLSRQPRRTQGDGAVDSNRRSRWIETLTHA